MTEVPRAVVLLSGGMDSTTLLYSILRDGYEVHALSVLYGQRHRKELEYAISTTRRLGVDHRILDLSSLGALLEGSSLTDSRLSIPHGHYTAANMAQTVVPNRNAFLLAAAYAWAISLRAVRVGAAMHAGDHAIYPDCRQEFITAFEEMEKTAVDREISGMAAPKLYAPFIFLVKAEIVKHGAEMGVQFQETWSCYEGGEIHCGKCGTCVERIEAFKLAGVEDPTQYLDLAYAEKVLEKK